MSDHHTTGSPVQFDGTISEFDGTIVSYHWDFGDGSYNVGQNQNPTHVYSKPGTYLVRLTAMDSRGREHRNTQDVVVEPSPELQEDFAQWLREKQAPGLMTKEVARSHLLGEDGTTVLGERPTVTVLPENHPAIVEYIHNPAVPVSQATEAALAEAKAAKEREVVAEELREKAVKELAEFKVKVAEVARRYATEYDWCSTVDDALVEMGIHPPMRRVKFNLQVHVTMEAEVLHTGAVTQQLLKASILRSQVARGLASVMDSGFTDVQATVNELSVDWDGSMTETREEE